MSTSAKTAVAWCEAGGHEYEREAARGRPPRSCPEHRPRPKRPPEVGAKVSAAKKGVRQLDLAPGELTLTEAWREFRVGRAVLSHGAENRKLRHRRVERPGRQSDAIVFYREQLREDLARWPCSYPGCEAPAPGRSGRCGDHAARGEPAVELWCQFCGARFTRPVSWLAELEGRGHYCSNECKGKAFSESRPGYLAELNRDGAHDHHSDVAEAVAAAGRLTTAKFAGKLATSASVIRADARRGLAPAELAVFDGERLLVGEGGGRCRQHPPGVPRRRGRRQQLQAPGDHEPAS